MKKLLSLIAIATFGLTTAFAQTPATTATPVKHATKKHVKATVAPVTAKTKVVANKAEVKKPVAVKTVKAAPAKVVAKGAKLKADGTADMRYKANKAKAVTAPAGPTKKDGTADMRYKANKALKKN